jgi:hypothetical protein
MKAVRITYYVNLFCLKKKYEYVAEILYSHPAKVGMVQIRVLGKTDLLKKAKGLLVTDRDVHIVVAIRRKPCTL